MRFFGCLWLLTALWQVPFAQAQVEQVDPDVAPGKPVKEDAAPTRLPNGRPLQPIDVPPSTDSTEQVEDEPVEPEAPKEVKKPVGKSEAKKAEPAAPAPPPAPSKPKVPPIVVNKITDARLDAAWDKWRAADASGDSKAEAEAAARAELLRLKAEAGASALEPFAIGLLRAAKVKEQAGSSATAIEMALNAVELAPDSPAVQVGLAQAYFQADPSELGRYVSSLGLWLKKLVKDPRTSRAALGDLGSVLLFAICATAVVVCLALFLRRVRYVLYDFHFLFPRGARRWQSAAVALLVLSLPVVFRLGVAPALLTLFAAVTLYLTLAERVVGAVLIGLLGLVPLAAESLVGATAFADTQAERAFRLEQGGPGSEAVALQLSQRAAEDKAGFAELAALGRFELRRGKLDLAIPRLKAALLKKPDDARAATNLGVAMLASGDIENPRSLFEAAARAEPTRGAAMFDLARFFQRRIEVIGGDQGAAEVDQGNVALAEAKQRDPSLDERKEPSGDQPPSLNTWLITEPLSRDDLVSIADSTDAQARVRSQLTLMLLGDVNETWAMFYPLLLGALLAAVGGLSRVLEAAGPCDKCGRPVSRREDPELLRGSTQCTQCVNVFSRKGVVPPALKVRKQVEVARYQTRMDRLSFGFGVVCSGLGHVFRGLPVRGTLYAFVFLFAVMVFVFRGGVMRSDYEAAPLWLKLLPAGLCFALVYALSLRGLMRKKVD